MNYAIIILLIFIIFIYKSNEKKENLMTCGNHYVLNRPAWKHKNKRDKCGYCGSMCMMLNKNKCNSCCECGWCNSGKRCVSKYQSCN
jgi:hypothetical protein